MSPSLALLGSSVKRNVFLTLGVLAVAGPSWAVDLGDGLVHLRAVRYALDSGPPAAARATAQLPETATLAWVVAFEGSADEVARATIESAGGRIAGFVPSNSYLVRADAKAARAITAGQAIRRVDLYQPEWKLAPEIDRAKLRTDTDARLEVEIWDGADPHAAAARVRALGVDVLRVDDLPGIRRLLVRAQPEALDAIAALSEVEWLEPAPTPTLRNDTVRWIIQSNNSVTMATPLFDHGLLGQGEIIGHIDAPPFIASCFFADTTDNTPGPNHRKIVGYRRVNPGGDQHGSNTAGIAAGENFDLGAPQWRGQAPKARLSHSSFYDLTNSNLAQFLTLAHADGARVHTNSWGDDFTTAYTAWCVDIDTFSRLNEDDLVVFAVVNGLGTLKSPENAKNCLAVGASGTAPNQANRVSGGAGPTADGRRKPEVYAPGQSVRTATPGTCETTLVTLGTSYACPAVAGGAALIRQYYRRGFWPTGRPWPSNEFIPTGALVKATVINSAVDMTGVPGYPSNAEGWGRILLDDALYFDGDARRLWVRDVRHAEGLATGQVDEWHVRVESAAEPLKITMAFMDQPASLGAAITPINNLDLEVVGPSGFYRGNVFDALVGQSIAGGTADALNDVERVILTTPVVGDWTIRVRGTAVPMGPQGYAIVVNGALAGRDSHTAAAPDLHPGPQVPRQPAEAQLLLDAPTPNPFRSTTTVRFVTAVESPVTVRVHDVSGRLVRTLLSRSVEPGDHRVIWDGKDGEGRRVSPGVYFVRVTAAGVDRYVKTALLR